MRELLKIYVRSLAERENAADGPHRYQDLGTFMCWLLERRGFSLHYRAYKYNGTVRRKSAGRQQYGTDILGSQEVGGVTTLYRFVLKAGDVGRKEWAPSRPGSMPHDLELAGGQGDDVDRQLVPGDIQWASVRVIAVHNGDVDRESIGPQIKTFCESIQRRYEVEAEWWDADRLVELALEKDPDPTLFPPSARPFIELVLGSLRKGRGGADFDHHAVDLLLNEALPLAGNLSALRLIRALAELALFAGMLAVECRRHAEDNCLPVLDTLERILCRAFEHLRQIDVPKSQETPIRKLLEDLLRQFAVAAEGLLRRLEPLLDEQYGLAFPLASERVDYPLRALRFSGYLASAGFARLDLKDQEGAQRLAAALVRLWNSNPAGCLSPVTDDQIIEISLVWELWLRCGLESEVAQQARKLAERLALRKSVGRPLPALWLRASTPMDPEHLRLLVEAHAGGRSESLPGFEDRGSTILPLTVYLACRLGPTEGFDLTPFLVEATMNQKVRIVYPQAWLPPDDAAVEWYREEIRMRGQIMLFDFAEGKEAFLGKFEEFNQKISRSPAEEWDLSSVDRMAWKLWRTPPPMAIFCKRAASA